jgi:ferredoxin
MYSTYKLDKSLWNSILSTLLSDYYIYAPFQFNDNLDYSLVSETILNNIVYNHPKPTSPIKSFFLPLKENVAKPHPNGKKRIIIGSPACDLNALSILDEIYLDKDFIDPNYSFYRENTLLIGCDCHTVNEHCHCTSYGYYPYPTENNDIVLSQTEGNILLTPQSAVGKTFLENYLAGHEQKEAKDNEKLHEIRRNVEIQLSKKNKELPDYRQTGELVRHADENIWKKYSDSCVSCGACSAICPTCSCFLFIERPGFEKVRSIDTCQYPGFERVAAGEDSLRPLSKRFRNRYLCKYVWKPEKFESKACTGCGRCIECCIGEIDKNELFRELTKKQTVET